MLKTKFFTIVSFLFLAMLLNSCFEVIEEVTIYADGKGKAGLTVNLSQAKGKLASIMLMDSIKGNPVPSEAEIMKELNNAKRIAEATQGIYDVELKTNFDNFIFELYCSFDSVECINHFVNNLENEYESREILLKNLFSYHNNKFIRNADFLIPNKHKKEIAKEKSHLLTARYISIVRLPTEVTSMSNEKAKLSKNKKNVMLKIRGDKLLENTSSITNIITTQ
ncbi:MAG: hypothetical protein COA97_09785 [Flavobacteriales bacterium]|nr:MAG: hypothetical protein COA97_09785 [Flavobacteriales bacterium]